jgi:two-component system NtrC family sensor kinase
MGLSSYIDYARQHLEEGRPREMLGRAQREVERIGRLVRDMLAFSRIKPQQAGDRADLAAAVTRALDFAREQGVLADIDVEVAVAAHTMVQCDEDSLHQVLLNLLINARDALALRASPRHLQIELGEAETDWVTLCVTDNGGTIPDEVRQRLFEPFYSTKGAGKGTGLGLAVSRQIIESAGGAIRLDVNYLAGARFIIRLKKEKRGEQREPEKNSGH